MGQCSASNHDGALNTNLTSYQYPTVPRQYFVKYNNNMWWKIECMHFASCMKIIFNELRELAYWVMTRASDWLCLRLMDQSQEILLGHAIFASSEYSYHRVARSISNQIPDRAEKCRVAKTSMSLLAWSWNSCENSSTWCSFPAFAASINTSSGMLVSRNKSLTWSITALCSWNTDSQSSNQLIKSQKSVKSSVI